MTRRGSDSETLSLRVDVSPTTSRYEVDELLAATLTLIEYGATALQAPTEPLTSVRTLLASVGLAGVNATRLQRGLASPAASDVDGFDAVLVAGDVERELRFSEQLIESLGHSDSGQHDPFDSRLADDIASAIALVVSLTSGSGRRARLSVVMPWLAGLGALIDRVERTVEHELRRVANTPRLVRSVNLDRFSVVIDAGLLLDRADAHVGLDQVDECFTSLFPSQPSAAPSVDAITAIVPVYGLPLGPTTRQAGRVVGQFGWSVDLDG